MEKSNILARFVTALSTIALYLPVIAGILTPMVWLLATWYFAWDFLAFILPYSDLMSGILIIGFTDIQLIVVWAIEIIVGIIGLALFIHALSVMVKERAQGTGLVTKGPYSIVRHPQHLGIIIFLLPVALFQITFTNFVGIRPGDIVSWLFMTFLLLVSADFEESRLKRKFGDEYEEYRQRTPFIIPRFKMAVPIKSELFEQGRPLRYVILFCVFWGMSSLVMYLFTFVELAWTL